MFKDTDCIGIFGIRGSGKTHLCRTIQQYFGNVFIIDVTGEYRNEENVFFNFKTFSDFVIESQNDNNIRAILSLPIGRDDQTEIADAAIELLYHRGNCLIVIEEIHNFATTHYLPPYFRHLALTGRHQNVGYVFTTQRIAEVNKTILTQCRFKFAGHVDNPTDERTLKEWGYQLNELNELNDFEFLMRYERENFKVNNDLEFIN